MVLTQTEIKQLFNYDPITGLLTWRTASGTRVKAGQIAGFIRKFPNRREYQLVTIGNKQYRAHRLIWVYMYGSIDAHIDHIDGDGSNNKLDNLRLANDSINARNQRKPDNNTSGVVGVYRSKNRKKWRACIKVHNKSFALGEYIEKWDAICARKSAEYIYNFHPNHGRTKVL